MPTLLNCLANPLALALVAVLAPQQPGGAAGAGATDGAGDRGAASTRAEDLRQRVRGMRMDLLLGGEKVRSAEQEAATFYGSKIGLVEQRLDTIHTDLSEKRARYDVALEQALAGRGGNRVATMRTAQELRAEITALEDEATELGSRRGDLLKAVDAVHARGRERESLAARIEASSAVDPDLMLPIGGIGLAPPVVARASASPLEDEALVQDLLARDPRGARQLLYEADPAGYWQRFPLRPPGDVLARVLSFPMPDLPGRR